MDGLREVPADGPRSSASAFREARHFAFDNIAVVHPSLDRSPCTIRIEGTRLLNPDWHLPLMDITGNLMTVGYERQVDFRDGYLTFAHETGHMFGLGHQGQPSTSIMRSREGMERSLCIEDQVRFHEAVETMRPGRDVLWMGSRSRLDLPSGRRRRYLPGMPAR
ncbi:MAG TPA: hypothetical protein RMH99_00470 [Sandaracinaceae bacterium LLY-WYZ-13_1]|nr:hypothetical protein [Sandaracinaceae bacterium LLY-WYZ-13_1]